MEYLRMLSEQEIEQLIPKEMINRLRARQKLFQMISDLDEPEDEILALLEQPLYQQEANAIIPRPTGDETFLMWAVWTLKKKVVERLLELGVDVKFINDIGSSVSTYWKIDEVKKNEQLACEIAELLHKKGVDLAQDGIEYSHSLATKAWDENCKLLIEKLKELGYRRSIGSIKNELKELKSHLRQAQKEYDEFLKDDRGAGLLIDISEEITEYHVRISHLEEELKNY